MKKLLLSFVSIAMMGLASTSCASHRSYRSTTITEGQSTERLGEWKRCAVCDGKGTCNACKGTGRISGDACRSCKGSGKCSTCKGNGGYYLDD